MGGFEISKVFYRSLVSRTPLRSISVYKEQNGQSRGMRSHSQRLCGVPWSHHCTDDWPTYAGD